MNMQPPFGFQNMGMMAPFGIMNKMSVAPALYIGNLDESIQEESLYDFFSKFGAIHFVRIMRDNSSGKSRGYGFVNFINPRDAENAKQYAQYEKLGKKEIRIMFKRPIKELNTDANLFVRNIDPNVTVRELHNHFINHGNVACAKIASSSDGKSLGYGYVQFEKPEDAEKALEALQNSKLKEKELQLGKFVPKDKRSSAAPKTNIYLKDLPNLSSPQELEKKIRQTINQITPGAGIKTMLVKKHPTEAKFCAFICFDENGAAEAFFNGVKNNPRIFDANSDVYVNWHQNRSERERELKREYAQSQNQTNLYIKNLKLDVTEEDVKKAFQGFGKVTSVAVKEWNSANGQSKAKFGFVAFDNAEDAKRAQSEGLQVQEIRNLYLPTATPYINLHQSKEKRNEYLLSQKRKKAQTGMMVPPMDMFNNRMPFPGGIPNRRFQPYPTPYGQMGGRPNPRGPKPMGQTRPNWNKGPQGQQQQQPRTGGPSDRPPRQQGGMQGGMRPQQSFNPQGPMQTMNQQQKPKTQPTTTTTKPSQPTQAVTVQSLKAKLNDFLALDEDKQRQILGELLFPLIRNKAPENLAPKITGMLIDLSVLEVTEILEFLEDPDLLQERVSEATELLLSSGN